MRIILNDKKAITTPSGCVEWTGRKDKHGYGLYKIKGKRHLAHRVSYQQSKGDIPTGLLVCHTCDVRHCVNPDHLFLGTNMDNVKDMLNKNRHYKQKKTHCIRGHTLSDDNIYTHVVKTGRTHRQCKACVKIRKG